MNASTELEPKADGSTRIFVRNHLSGEGYDFTALEKHETFAFLASIAKMAYCFAVAALGLAAFDGEAIRHLLRGDTTSLHALVGGWTLEVPYPIPPSLHVVELWEMNGLLVGVVTLFATHGALPYAAVLGSLKNQGEKWAEVADNLPSRSGFLAR